MDRRKLIVGGLAAGGLSACASPNPGYGPAPSQPNYPVEAGPAGAAPPPGRAPEYSAEELAQAGSNFLGVAAEAVGATIERIANEQNGRRPTAYIAGQEGSGAFAVGLRYGRGVLYMKQPPTQQEVFWQGPRSAGTSAATPRGSSPWSMGCNAPTTCSAASPAWKARPISWAGWA
jgi:hypothetical protein